MKYYLIAGEASGDLHGANLIRSLKALDGEADFRFYGGDLMQRAGGTLVRHYKDTAVMGFVAVLANARKILANIKDCKKDIAEYRPDALVLIDYPGFNLKIARFARKIPGLKIFYYIPPKIWAWKEGRAGQINRYVDEVYGIFPFEPGFYRSHSCDKAVYVGNPCVQAVQGYRHGSKEAFIERNGLERGKKIIAMLPGSRKQEVEQTISLFNKLYLKEFPDCQFVVAATGAVDPNLYSVLKDDFYLVFDETYELLSFSHAALVNSGTATLETALFKVPQVVCYPMRVPALLYRLARKLFLKIPYISLVNIICGSEAVTELVGPDLTPAAATECLHKTVYDTEYRRKISADYDTLSGILGTSVASDTAAGKIVRTLCCK